MQRLLGEPIDLDFEHTSLDNVLKYIGAVKPGLRLTIDPEVQRAGIDLASRVVDFRARGITVASALNLLLGGDLSYLVQLDGLMITTREKVLRHLSIASYPVADLLGRMAGNTGETVEAALEQLAELIRRHVNSADDPYMADWEGAGGNGAMTYKEGALVITQTASGHKQVVALLDVLDRALAPGAVQAGPPASKALEETRARLADPIDLDFEHTSLDNVLEYISEVTRGLNIVPDPELAGLGVDLSARVVDLKVKGVSIEEVLNLILAGNLAYVVGPGYVLVITRERACQQLPLGAYRVDDLLAASDSSDFSDWQELVDILKRNINNIADPNVAPWTDEGGPAAVDYLHGLMVITQTRTGHEQVAALLQALDRALAPGAAQPGPVASKALEETRARLADPIDLDFKHTRLDNVLKYISEVKRGLNIVLDPKLADAGVDLSARVVDLKVKRVSIEEVLNLILAGDLAYVVRPGYVLVTTRDRAYERLPLGVYRLRDYLGSDREPLTVNEELALLSALDGAVNNATNPAVAVWVSEGGWGTADIFHGTLVVTQTYEGHRKVRQYLESLRRARGRSDR